MEREELVDFIAAVLKDAAIDYNIRYDKNKFPNIVFLDFVEAKQKFKLTIDFIGNTSKVK